MMANVQFTKTVSVIEYNLCFFKTLNDTEKVTTVLCLASALSTYIGLI